jgi:tRNA dimethylallyltransferase
MKRQLPKILVVCGPTATGKSDLAVNLALKFNGEIISADSRQVYTGLDIGSGKITHDEMKGVPHHLLDVINPKKTYTVEQFKNDGKALIKQIILKGKLPIICGGTGFYIDALVFDEEFPAVKPDNKLRKALAKKTPESLMKMIQKLDSRRAKELDPHNKVKIIRAIEISKTLGSVPRLKRKILYETLFIGITTSREKMRERIHERLLKRIDAGMIQEVDKLRKNGVTWKRLHALGLEYRYVALFLQHKISKDEMLQKLENQIVKFSKRQMTWFKRNKKITWLSIEDIHSAEKLARNFIQRA